VSVVAGRSGDSCKFGMEIKMWLTVRPGLRLALVSLFMLVFVRMVPVLMVFAGCLDLVKFFGRVIPSRPSS
jgi:hypothetical protein